MNTFLLHGFVVVFFFFFFLFAAQLSLGTCTINPISLSLKIESNLASSIFKISHQLSHPTVIIYLIVMPTLTLLNSQSQQNATDTASAKSTSNLCFKTY